MERGVLPLQGGFGGFGREERDGGREGNLGEDSDSGNHGPRMDDLRNCQGRGTANANPFLGLAITRSRKVMNLEWIATHAIQCSCY